MKTDLGASKMKKPVRITWREPEARVSRSLCFEDASGKSYCAGSIGSVQGGWHGGGTIHATMAEAMAAAESEAREALALMR